MPSPLVRAFLEGAQRDAPREEEALAARLDDVVARGARAWPGFRVDEVALARHVGAVLGADAKDAVLERLHAADFYLAFASAQGDAAAVAALQARLLTDVPRFVAGLGGGATFGIDVARLVIEKLLVAPHGQAPRIAEYDGRSALGAWVRVVSTRAALSLLRKDRRLRRHPERELDARAPVAAGDPELDYMRARYKDEFRASLHAVLAKAPETERTLLRLHYLDGLTIDELGAIFAVHRSTVARRIAQCRERILEKTRELLVARLGMTPSEIDSVLRLVQSELTRGLAQALA